MVVARMDFKTIPFQLEPGYPRFAIQGHEYQAKADSANQRSHFIAQELDRAQNLLVREGPHADMKQEAIEA